MTENFRNVPDFLDFVFRSTLFAVALIEKTLNGGRYFLRFHAIYPDSARFKFTPLISRSADNLRKCFVFLLSASISNIFLSF